MKYNKVKIISLIFVRGVWIEKLKKNFCCEITPNLLLKICMKLLGFEPSTD